MLRLADGLTLPTGAVTETFLVVGKRGSGKSSTATRLAEQLMDAKVPIAVLDPVDVWWGLKAGADGSTGGYPVYVFGGEHANLPLEATAGTLMADTLVDHRINAVFVLRQFSNRDKARFVSDFAEQLYKRNRDAMHLFCEEAHELMPQNPYGGEEEMLGRMIRIAKLGRTSGIGVSAITQRPASLSKNFTTQAEVLVAHRITGPQDRDAIEGWIKHHNVGDEKAQVLESLPTLKTGEAWFWAPDFPEDKPIGLRRVQVLMPETFDSRRTPKPGEKRKEPKALAAVDLEKLGEKMAATKQRAQENDPRALRAEIARLKAVRHDKEVVTRVEHKRVEIPVLKDAQIVRLEKAVTRLEDAAVKAAETITQRINDASTLLAPIKVALSAASSNKTWVDGAAVRAAAPAASLHRPSTARAQMRPTVRSGEPRAPSQNGLAPRQQRIIDTLASLAVLEIEPSRDTVAAWAGSHPNSKGFSNDLSTLRSSGYIDGLQLTAEGSAHADPNVAPASLEWLVSRVSSNLPPRQRRILDLVLEHPDGLSRDELAEILETHPNTKGYGNDLSALRSRGLITKGSPIRPAEFFSKVAS